MGGNGFLLWFHLGGDVWVLSPMAMWTAGLEYPLSPTFTPVQIQEVLTEVQRARFQPKQPEGATQILGPRASGTSSPGWGWGRLGGPTVSTERCLHPTPQEDRAVN